MRKLNKVFIAIFVLALVTPSLALASWWNPASWFDFIFHKTNNVEIVQTISTTTDAQIATGTPQIQVASSTISTSQQNIAPPIKKKPVVKQVTNVVTVPSPTPILAPISTSTPASVTVTLCLNGMTLASNCATAPNGTATTIEPTLLLESQPQYLCPNAMTLASNCILPANAVAVPLCPNGTTLASNCLTLPDGTLHQNTTFCNGTSYTQCPTGQSFVCPGDGGKAYCQLPKQNPPLFLNSYSTINYTEQSSQNAAILLQQQQQQQQLQQVQSSLDQMERQQEAQKQQQLFQQQLLQMRPNCNQLSFGDHQPCN